MPGPLIPLAVTAAMIGVPMAPFPHDDDGIEILDAGDPASRVVLGGATVEAGDEASVVLTETSVGYLRETNVWLDDPMVDVEVRFSARVGLDLVVTDVDDDGSFDADVAVLSFSARSLGDNSPDAAEFRQLGAYESLVDETLRFSFDEYGELRSVDPDGDDLSDDQVAALWQIEDPALLSIAPSEPVGNGSVWTFDRDGDAYLCGLVVTDDGRVAIDATVVPTADVLDDFATTFDLTGSKFGGILHIDAAVTEPFDLDRVEMRHIAANGSLAGREIDMELASTVHTVFTPR